MVRHGISLITYKRSFILDAESSVAPLGNRTFRDIACHIGCYLATSLVSCVTSAPHQVSTCHNAHIICEEDATSRITLPHHRIVCKECATSGVNLPQCSRHMLRVCHIRCQLATTLASYVKSMPHRVSPCHTTSRHV